MITRGFVDSKYIEHNGKRYVRVSQILQDLNDFSAIPPEVLEHKCQIGTWTHAAIDDEINDRYPYVPMEFMEETAGYIESFRRWRDILKMGFVETSKRYFDDSLMITGELDALVVYPGKTVPVVLDFKTSANESKTWILQGHFYHYLAEVNEKKVGKKIYFVKLQKQGLLPKVYEYNFSQATRDECILRAQMYREANISCLQSTDQVKE